MGFEKLDGGRQDKIPYSKNNKATKCFLQNLFLEITSFLSWLVVEFDAPLSSLIDSIASPR